MDMTCVTSSFRVLTLVLYVSHLLAGAQWKLEQQRLAKRTAIDTGASNSDTGSATANPRKSSVSSPRQQKQCRLPSHEIVDRSYQKEVNPNFEVEIESIPNDTQYFQKLRTYIAGNQLPTSLKSRTTVERKSG
ncbi:hypothetical protein [Cohnella faecalis]|uniref:hypothetical protein n=1 Tax=Cohnella faecalis TaxID=2315694 RepID=UPI0011C241CF|nr:hypothetical protein [Cohnella faecalis]